MESHEQRQSITMDENRCRIRTVYDVICRAGKCTSAESVFRKCPNDRNEVLLSSSKKDVEESETSPFQEQDHGGALFPGFDIFIQDPLREGIFERQPGGRRQQRREPRDPYIDAFGEDV